MIALVSAGRWAYAIVVPLVLYAGQTALDVWAEKAKRRPKTGTRKRAKRSRKRR
jgi:hypothetical protein